MKTRNQILYFPLLMMGILLLFSISCKKDDNTPVNPTNGKTTAVFNPDLVYGTLTDIDGNEYKTIKVGDQTWMAENLRTFKYNDGTAIPNVKGNIEWAGLTTEAYCTYNNTTKNDSIATFGCLYNWYAVITGKLAPKGWHVPTDAEWTTLINYLGGESVAGGKLKEIGTSHWVSPNTGATNESGFTALPSGTRNSNGTFQFVETNGSWWCNSEVNASNAWSRSMAFYGSSLYRDSDIKEHGFSVRCVRD
jgi:uncharacterized protein (TIGR02145 family)